MAVHILRDNGHFVVIRCPTTDADAIIVSLKASAFQCGTIRDAEGIPQLVEFNVRVDEKWNKVHIDKLQETLRTAGFRLAE